MLRYQDPRLCNSAFARGKFNSLLGLLSWQALLQGAPGVTVATALALLSGMLGAGNVAAILKLQDMGVSAEQDIFVYSALASVVFFALSLSLGFDLPHPWWMLALVGVSGLLSEILFVVMHRVIDDAQVSTTAALGSSVSQTMVFAYVVARKAPTPLELLASIVLGITCFFAVSEDQEEHRPESGPSLA